MNGTYSYHIFYFPFKWEIPGRKHLDFSGQVDLSKVNIDTSFWERVRLTERNELLSDYTVPEHEKVDLFAEQNYFFEFVHPAMYDSIGQHHPLLMHFERKEPRGGDVKYIIETKGKRYILKTDAINLNLYSTGVGVLSFFLANEADDQLSPGDILMINQYGRRIMPPYYGEIHQKRSVLADSLSVVGLNGLEDDYFEDFSSYRTSDCWKPAKFITSLIRDLSAELEVNPVIDDRMIVNCSYLNEELSECIKDDSSFPMGDFWYKYVFVDEDYETCQNDEMKNNLLGECTYYRWQKDGSLYGVTKYSMVLLSGTGWFPRNIMVKHMGTLYSKMLELVLAQRASILRFSDEVTQVSHLPEREEHTIEERIGSLYREYIRFVNQMKFKTISAQDQGIEMYTMLLDQSDSEVHMKDLNDEIGELHQYYSVLSEKKRNESAERLNKIAIMCLPATVLAGMFGMNPICGVNGSLWWESASVVLSIGLSYMIFKLLRKK